jgi:hypothetical protein
MTDNFLTLFCIVDGESTSFPAVIDPTKTVGELKDEIKTKKAPEFDDIAADKLSLWKVEIPDDDDDEEIPILLNAVSTKDKKKLKASRELKKFFTEPPPKETIHIIVQRPPPAPGNAHTRLLLFVTCCWNELRYSILMLSSLCRPRVGV